VSELVGVGDGVGHGISATHVLSKVGKKTEYVPK
jgi:hypothetical protein